MGRRGAMLVSCSFSFGTFIKSGHHHVYFPEKAPTFLHNTSGRLPLNLCMATAA